jgi:hypothetical protein
LNTESADESALRTALQGARPPLQEPADRLAEVGDRVRRFRVRTTAAAALAVVVVLTGGGALAAAELQHRRAPAIPAGADCPSVEVPTPPDPWTDAPGPLVPNGAIRATLCERPRSGSQAGSSFKVDYSPRMLTQRVDQLVSWISSLPGPALPMCFLIEYSSVVSLVFAYADGPPVVVWVDFSCSTLFTAKRVRYTPYMEELDAFYQLYRAQLRATTPVATIPTPTCPTTYDPLVDTAATLPDGIRRNRGSDAWLPDPLAALAACRYELAGQTWVLSRQEQRRTELESARLILNEQYAHREGDSGCRNDRSSMRPTLVDSVWVADTTGAVSEMRVWRRPCAEVDTADSSLEPVAEVLTYLDGMLGTLG